MRGAEGGFRQRRCSLILQVHSVESMALVPQPLPLSVWGLVINSNTIPGVSPPGMTSIKVGGPGPPKSMGRREQKA